MGLTGRVLRDWRADRQRAADDRARHLRAVVRRASIPVDWSEDFAVLGGGAQKLQVAHIKLSPSQAFLVELLCKPTRCCSMPIALSSQVTAVFQGDLRYAPLLATASVASATGQHALPAMANHYVFE
jgi:hypothetical protein